MADEPAQVLVSTRVQGVIGFVCVNVVTETYQEFAPTEALRNFVDCYWSSTRSATAAATDHRVLPDGCIDIIFDLSPGSHSRGRIVGTMTKPLLLHWNGPVQFIAVRFRPGGAVPFLHMPADELTDLQCELSDIWRCEPLLEQLLAVGEVASRIRRLESALVCRLKNIPAVDRRVRAAVMTIQQSHHGIEAVAEQIGISRQHLTRLFRKHVGIGPKCFARVDRLQRLRARTIGLTHENWATIALDAGYYDQAHMIAECRSLTGLTPTELCTG